MIDVQEVLRSLPHFETFCSIEKLHGLVDELRVDAQFDVTTAGVSVNGVPIHHVRFGRGSIKALITAGNDAPEPIGSLTVFGLMKLLQQRHRTLLEADIEWHFVPCIDPDGALLNEVWTQDFTFEKFLRNYYSAAAHDRVDTSFPIDYGNLVWDRPSKEARVLQELLERIRPDFYFPLHNTRVGGAYYYLSRDIGQPYYRQIYELLEQQDIPLQKEPSFKEIFPQFAEGILALPLARKMHDHVSRFAPPSATPPIQESGVGSWDYLSEINPDALIFVAEAGCVQHPAERSHKNTDSNLRRLRLRIDTDCKYLASVLLAIWDQVKGDLDTSHPIYRAIDGGWVLPEKQTLNEGMPPVCRVRTREVLFNPMFDRKVTEREVFGACTLDSGFYFIQISYPFIRLLRESPQTPALQQAIERAECAFAEVRSEIGRYFDANAFELIACDRLAKFQIGSGLIALNSLLEPGSARKL